MNEYLLVKFLHTVGFAYWLGGDLGVFVSSFAVVNETLPRQARVAAARILFAVDLGPRISMTLTLPLGVHLAWALGLMPFGPMTLAAIWCVCLGWLAMVIALHAAAGGRFKSALTGFDFRFRVAVALGLIGAGLYSLLGPGTLAYWIAAKLAIFGGLVGCGVLIRMRLKPFLAAYARLAGGTVTDADNAAMRKHLGATRPIVVTIWLGLLASAALGMHLI